MPRLKKVDSAGPGITRRRRGRGWQYLDEDGRKVEDPEVVARIQALAIPPAWQDVWISVEPMGHIQATGTDAAGRKQYRYHDKWRERRDAEKFESMILFAKSLPRLRKRVARDLEAGEELGRERVLACATRLLDKGFFRVGSEGYAEENETYGLATILKEPRDHRRQRDALRLRGQGQQAAGAAGERPGHRRAGGDAQAAALGRRRAAGLQARQPLGGREVRGRERVPQGRRRRRLHRQGLPHVERDRAGRAGPGALGRGRAWPPRPPASGRSSARSTRPPATWATRRRCAARRTSTRGSSTASTAA